MTRRTLLRLPRPCSLQALLDALVARTNERLGPHRPQVTTLTPVVAEGNELPAFISIQSNSKVGLIFSEEPSPTLALGDFLLFICFRPTLERGSQCEGMFSGEVVVDVWQDKNYPLSEIEVEWLIADHCGCEGHHWLRLTTCWRKLQIVCGEDLAAIDMNAILLNSPAGSRTGSRDDNLLSKDAHGKCANQQDGKPPEIAKCQRKANVARRGNGKPRKKSTFWLLAQMRLLENLHDYQRLFPGWLHEYERCEGQPPANPRVSFIEAAEANIERILHEGNQR